MSEVHQNEESQAQNVDISEVIEVTNGKDSVPATVSMNSEHATVDDANKTNEPNNDLEKTSEEQNNTIANVELDGAVQEATESGHTKTTDLIDVGQHPKDKKSPLSGEVVSNQEDAQVQQTKTSDDIDASIDKENKSEIEKHQPEETTVKKISLEKSQARGSSSATVPPTTAEDQEVTSTRNDDPPKSARLSSRRQSYNSGRGYVGGYQNYGLTYLPYKSNFEPSENARRKADEFFKTLKL